MTGKTRRPGRARTELAFTAIFIMVLAACVHFGGPAHAASMAIVCVIYFIFGFSVVRRGLLVAGMIAFPLSLLGDPHSGDVGNVHVSQTALWLGTAVLWIPAMLGGYALRARLDQRRGPRPRPRRRPQGVGPQPPP